MILPKQDPQGVPFVSYTQISLWNEAKGYNTGMAGKHEFIRSYFLGEKYPDRGGFGEFGEDVEAYITKRERADKFTPQELTLLEGIKPLGNFQKEIRIPFDGFYLKGYIDDTSDDGSIIRDYKTASEKSKEKYGKDDYWQLDVYALDYYTRTGQLPNKLELYIIERLGNGFKGGRSAMSVGERKWHVLRQTSIERLDKLKASIASTAEEISAYYQVFLKLNQ